MGMVRAAFADGCSWQEASGCRVISGIVHMLKSGTAGAIVPKPMVRRQRSVTASCDGHDAAFGKICSVGLLGLGLDDLHIAR